MLQQQWNDLPSSYLHLLLYKVKVKLTLTTNYIQSHTHANDGTHGLCNFHAFSIPWQPVLIRWLTSVYRWWCTALVHWPRATGKSRTERLAAENRGAIRGPKSVSLWWRVRIHAHTHAHIQAWHALIHIHTHCAHSHAAEPMPTRVWRWNPPQSSHIQAYISRTSTHAGVSLAIIFSPFITLTFVISLCSFVNDYLNQQDSELRTCQPCTAKQCARLTGANAPQPIAATLVTPLITFACGVIVGVIRGNSPWKSVSLAAALVIFLLLVGSMQLGYLQYTKPI